MTIDILNELEEKGTLKQLVNAGMMTTFIIDWIKIYNLYTEMINEGSQINSAVLATCDVFDISKTTFYRIKKNMEYPEGA